MSFTTFRSIGGLYGVEDERGGLVYEAEFPKRVAERLAELAVEHDWEASRQVMIEEGLWDPVHEKPTPPRKAQECKACGGTTYRHTGICSRCFEDMWRVVTAMEAEGYVLVKKEKSCASSQS